VWRCATAAAGAAGCACCFAFYVMSLLASRGCCVAMRNGCSRYAVTV
jgi:hypothetical protein